MSDPAQAHPVPIDQLDYLPRLPRRSDVGIGCIGAGFIMADCQLVAYREAGFHVVAITSRRAERAREVAARHRIDHSCSTIDELLADLRVEVVDVAVPPDIQPTVIGRVLERRGAVRAILAQKPLAPSYAEARRLVDACRQAGVTLSVNQNMRYDQSIRACNTLLRRGMLGQPVLATIDMRAIPHWMPWQQRQGWLTLRIMSIHHLDAFRFWFGDPERVWCSVRTDPRTAFPHRDGVCLYALEYADGLRAVSLDDVWAGPAREGAAADLGIRWRVEGTTGLAQGTIGWPEYPVRCPSTLDYTTIATGAEWFRPRWPEVWFPDAFAGPMAQLLCALEQGGEPELSADDNLRTMALVEACYRSAAERRAVELAEVLAE